MNKNFDLTPWIEWHLNTLNDAMKQSLINIEYFIQKTKFWDKHRSKALNERQLKVLNKILTQLSQVVFNILCHHQISPKILS
ncbi:hypothetical protein N5U22_10185 [Aliarcobacter cryaerophilus]|uniref:hypothetical protein n=1 Tax=Aliarcobacter cryaerophilus TaxID=28198 RepID=UPI0021B530B7|nr:hypothetical protein [Aliarcobacter cryaerophilus]MCT7533783.1 hypothetical protein [Aliarcobacter cryaerophilus]MCT7542177.1 hypothetical protein [Aliarcobacter cryaerophilus]